MVEKNEVRDILMTVNDPELGIDIWTLGLIYNVEVDGSKVVITMTFTTPACPYGPALVEDVKKHVNTIEGITETVVDITFDPPWEPNEDLRAMLGV